MANKMEFTKVIATMKIDIPENTHIADAAAEALRIAQMIGIRVQFWFNGPYVDVNPTDTIQEVVDYYNAMLNARMEKARKQ